MPEKLQGQSEDHGLYPHQTSDAVSAADLEEHYKNNPAAYPEGLRPHVERLLASTVVSEAEPAGAEVDQPIEHSEIDCDIKI